MANVLTTVDLSENHDAEVISIAVVFSLLSLASVIARIKSKKMKNNPIAIDDYLLVAAWVIACAECSMYAAATHYAKGGWHEAVLTLDELVAFQKTLFVSSALQTTSLALSKLSLLVLLYRIFVIPGFRLTVYILGGVVMCWWIAAFFGGVFICSPISSLWNPTTQGTCGNQYILDAVTPLPWALTDFAILIAPIPVIRGLQVPKRKRLSLYAMFLFGGITCCISVTRYGFLFYRLDDVSYSCVPIVIMSMAEVNVTVACSALVACQPVLALIISDKLLNNIRNRWAARSQTKHMDESTSMNRVISDESTAVLHQPEEYRG